jgi:pilus assembly protein CpaE
VYGLTIGAIIGSHDLYQEIQAATADLPIQIVMEQREIGDWTAFLEKLERARPDVLLLGLEELDIPLGDVVRRIKSTVSFPRVIVVNRSADPDVILQTLRSGADEYIYPPLGPDLRAALERMASERAKNKAGTAPRGRVFGFLGAKGGCGTTTFSCHLAVEFHRLTGLNVLLADFDTDNGIIGFLMKSKSPYTVADAVENVQRLDLSFWKALVSNGYPGVEVMMAPTGINVRRRWNVEDFRHLIPFMRANYDWSVIDLGRSLSPLALAVLEDLDVVYLVTTLEVPSLHQAKQLLQALWDAGFSRDRVKVILNRMPKRSEISVEELDRMLGTVIFATVPNDFPALFDAYAERRLLPPESQLGRHFTRVAAKITGVEQKVSKSRFSFLG